MGSGSGEYYNPQAPHTPPHTPPQTPPRLQLEVECAWQSDSDDDEKGLLGDRVKLLRRESRASSSSPSRGDDSNAAAATKLERLLPRRFLAVLMLLAVVVGAMYKTGVAVSPADTSPRVHETKLIQQLGWLGAIEEIRLDLSQIAKTMKKDKAKTDMIDISPLYDLLEDAINTVGVRGIFFELFHGLNRYIKSDKHCSKDIGHGVGCGPNDPWWLQHYVGIVTADLLVRDGQLLLDGTTGERIYDAVSFMRELHSMQQNPYTTEMSFHAEHGFILHYLAVTQPNVQTYPLELAHSFCSEFLTNNIRNKAAHKNIGSECYHGFGHAVFAVVSARQLGNTINARKQFRPNGGFALTEKAICEAYRLCEDAPDSVWVPQKFCFGGFQHSAQLLNTKLNDPEKRDAFFDKQKKRCGYRTNKAVREFFEEKSEKVRLKELKMEQEGDEDSSSEDDEDDEDESEEESEEESESADTKKRTKKKKKKKKH